MLQAGTKENIIPDDATLELNIRTYDEDVRAHVLAAVHRICRAECVASGAPDVPSVFWFVGGTDPAVYADAKAKKQLDTIPSNHSPRFAPTLDPTLKTGLQAMLAAASAWLCDRASLE
jgi:hippurate hydrolase